MPTGRSPSHPVQAHPRSAAPNVRTDGRESRARQPGAVGAQGHAARRSCGRRARGARSQRRHHRGRAPTPNRRPRLRRAHGCEYRPQGVHRRAAQIAHRDGTGREVAAKHLVAELRLGGAPQRGEVARSTLAADPAIIDAREIAEPIVESARVVDGREVAAHPPRVLGGREHEVACRLACWAGHVPTTRTTPTNPRAARTP